MARRRGDEATTHAGLDPVATGVLTALVAADSDILLSPRSLNYTGSADGSGSLSMSYYSELATGSVEFWRRNFAVNESDSFAFPEQFEVPKGSGIAVTALTEVASIDLYYVAHDEAAGIEKSAARNASYLLVQNPGVHAGVTRAPYGRNF